MRWRLHKLLSGPVGKTQRETLDSGPLALDSELSVHYLRGTLTFTRLTESVMLQGVFDTATTVECARSLEEFELCLTLNLEDILFTLPGFPAEEPDRVVGDDGWLDLTETLREEILMAIPINPICPKCLAASADALPSGVSADDEEWLTVHWHSAERKKEE